MKTLFLRFDTRDAALAALGALGLTEAADGVSGFPSLVVTDDGRVDIDVLGGGTGIVLRPTGATTIDPETGAEEPETEPRPGFHLNLLWWGQTPPDFGAAAIDPAAPTCVFA